MRTRGRRRRQRTHWHARRWEPTWETRFSSAEGDPGDGGSSTSRSSTSTMTSSCRTPDPRRARRVQPCVHRPQHLVGHQRLSRHPLLGTTKTSERTLVPGSQSQQHRPRHRARIDLSSPANRTALWRQTFDLHLRQQRGQRLSNPNTLEAGYGKPGSRGPLRLPLRGRFGRGRRARSGLRLRPICRGGQAR